MQLNKASVFRFCRCTWQWWLCWCCKCGDVLEISIWEAPPAVLFGTTFSSEGQGSGHVTQLPSQIVNKNGTVTVPFVGNISVAGKTPEAIQAQIVASLSRKADQPQAVVKIANNNSSDVTVIRQGNCCAYAINCK